MAGAYRCPNCQSTTVVVEGDAPLCVPCQEIMVLAGATLPGDDPSDAGPAIPLAPLNTDAYVKGLAEIEDAKRQADQEEREYLRAKDYAGKAKKRLEAAESKLRGTVQAVADRLRPRPLFDHADHHTKEELVAMLAAENVQVTAEAVRGWTDAQRADARAWCLAAHSEQPRLIPPFLWAGGPSDDAPVDPDAPPEPDPAERHEDDAPAPINDHPGQHYPERRKRAKKAV